MAIKQSEAESERREYALTKIGRDKEPAKDDEAYFAWLYYTGNAKVRYEYIAYRLQQMASGIPEEVTDDQVAYLFECIARDEPNPVAKYGHERFAENFRRGAEKLRTEAKNIAIGKQAETDRNIANAKESRRRKYEEWKALNAEFGEMK